MNKWGNRLTIQGGSSAAIWAGVCCAETSAVARSAVRRGAERIFKEILWKQDRASV